MGFPFSANFNQKSSVDYTFVFQRFVPIRGSLSREYFSPNKKVPFLAGMNPCAEFVRPGLFVPLFFLFLWLAASSAPRTHRDVRSLSAFQKIDQFPASLSGLSGPMVASHSCVSSWQGRMRRRTIEPAISSEQGITSEHQISLSCYRGRFRSRAIRS